MKLTIETEDGELIVAIGKLMSKLAAKAASAKPGPSNDLPSAVDKPDAQSKWNAQLIASQLRAVAQPHSIALRTRRGSNGNKDGTF